MTLSSLWRALTVLDCEAPPGLPGPALHLHHAEDEAFFVTPGTLTVQAGGNRSEVSSGGFIWAPRGVAHGFCNASDEPVRLLVLVVRGNLEKMMREITSYFAEAAPAVTPARIIDINQAHGLDVVGPPILNAPVPGD